MAVKAAEVTAVVVPSRTLGISSLPAKANEIDMSNAHKL